VDGTAAKRAHPAGWALVLALVAACLVGAAGRDAGARTAAGPAPDLQLLSEQRLSDRTLDLTFRTPALAEPTKVRVLLPTGFDPAAAMRYPVLYLLHGGAADYTSWTEQGGTADALTEGLPLITVMADAGRSAWYTDWYNNGAGGQPMWETYHIRQLIPWVDAHLPTIADRAGRAVAGLSSGGFGTMSYASRHPDLFVAAAAFSGALDTNTPPVVAGKVIDALAAQDGGVPGSLFGLRETEEVRWRGHNPWDLASNLRDTAIVVRTGNGDAGGPYGGGGPADPGGAALERACHDQSVSFHERLDALGIEHVWDDYGPGTHNFSYWNHDLQETLPGLMQVFAEHRPAPSPFSYRAIERRYEIYGWTVSMDRPAVEFSSLDDARASGFRLSGSGAGTVDTGPLYQPGATYVVTMRGESGAVSAAHVAGSDGRLHLDVPLGPANPAQQRFTPSGDSPLTAVHTTTVSIAPAPTDAGT
jgi:S-formylglutathione hydrolase FrmB